MADHWDRDRARLKAAILTLDPKDDSHWTPDKILNREVPNIQVVEKASGREGLTRKDITAAVESWWSRKHAIKAAA